MEMEWKEIATPKPQNPKTPRAINLQSDIKIIIIHKWNE